MVETGVGVGEATLAVHREHARGQVREDVPVVQAELAQLRLHGAQRQTGASEAVADQPFVGALME